MSKVLVFDIETTGLFPLRDRVTCICGGIWGANSVPVCFSGDFEAKIISDFVKFVVASGADKILSYNGWSFDVPFLRVRAMKNNVKLPGIFWQDNSLIDPFHVLCRNMKGKQSDFAQLLGQDCFGSGLECLDWFKKGDFESIEKHCASDVVVLDSIYSSMISAGFEG